MKFKPSYFIYFFMKRTGKYSAIMTNSQTFPRKYFLKLENHFPDLDEPSVASLVPNDQFKAVYQSIHSYSESDVCQAKNRDNCRMWRVLYDPSTAPVESG